MRKFAALVLAIVAAGAVLGQARKQTRTAEVTAPEMVYRWDTNEFVFRGNCVLQVHDANRATMRAPAMKVKLGPKGATIDSLRAEGPVNILVITAPDKEGVKRKITARCSDHASYTEKTQEIQLVGDAVADVVSLPEGPESMRAHFTGDALIVSLKKSEVRAENARLRVEGIVTPPSQGR